ncbi:MAG: protein-L-isoaspartate O-methyltransferase [Gammaproteobacteria bacterium]
MIGQQLRAWGVLDEHVLDVMRNLPRERFVPPEWAALAYADAAIPVGQGKTLPPPKIQGRILDALDPKPGDSALEIGTGTGYLTACLARLTSHVTSVEIHDELSDIARANLEATGIRNVRLLVDDAFAMEFSRRYDVIAVNGSLPVRHERFENLLAIGGRMFELVGSAPVMQAWLIVRKSDRQFSRQELFETCLPALENAPRPEAFVF